MTTLRYALRSLARSPAFVVTAVLMLAIGISANTIVMSIAEGLALRPVPAVQPDRMVRIYPVYSGERRESVVSYTDYEALERAAPSLKVLTGYIPETVTLRSASVDRLTEPRDVLAYYVSGSYFPILGAQAAIGRTLSSSQSAAPVAVISNRLWRQLGARSDALTVPLVVNGQPFDVVGVMPADFVGTEPLAPDLWLPISSNRSLQPGATATTRADLFVLMLGRLTDGTTANAAGAQLSEAIRVLTSARPYANRASGVRLERATFFPIDRDQLAVGMLVLLVTSLLLAATAANVTNLGLIRALKRQREIAIRLAIGARRERIASELLIESLCIALAAGGLALLLSTWTLGPLSALVKSRLPMSWGEVLFDFTPDARVFLFTFALSLVVTIAVGLTPAVQGTRVSLSNALHGSQSLFVSREGWLRPRTLMAIAQVAIGLALAVVAGLLARAAARAEQVDLGFKTAGVLTTQYDLDRHHYTPARAAAFTRELAAGAARLEGVRMVTLASHLPLTGGLRTTTVWSPEQGQERARQATRYVFIAPGYFRMLDIPLVRGRDLAADNLRRGRHEAVISEILAARLWPRSGGIGERLRTDLTTDEYVVVGIARDTRASSLWRDKEAAVYLSPAGDAQTASMRVVVAATGEHAATELRRLARRLEPELVVDVASLDETVALWVLPSRVAGSAGIAIAGLALLIASLGVYGVLAHLMAQRTREFGIRGALGATSDQLVRLSLVQGMRLVVPGVGCGLLLGYLIARAVASFLYDVSPGDAITYAVASVVVLMATLSACYLPARRASRLDPMAVLRNE